MLDAIILIKKIAIGSTDIDKSKKSVRQKEM